MTLLAMNRLLLVYVELRHYITYYDIELLLSNVYVVDLELESKILKSLQGTKSRVN